MSALSTQRNSATRAFSWHQDVRLLRSSINFENMPKQGSPEPKNTGKTVGKFHLAGISRKSRGLPSRKYRQSSRNALILPVSRAKAGVSRTEKYRQNSRKSSILPVFRARAEASRAENTGKVVGTLSSCRYLAPKQGGPTSTIRTKPREKSRFANVYRAELSTKLHPDRLF